MSGDSGEAKSKYEMEDGEEIYDSIEEERSMRT